MKGLYRVLCLFCLGLLTMTGSAQNNINSLGIAPQEEKYFLTERINCKDGSKAFARDRLNDDFCDCPDGTDEPGTSACPEGKFYCRNSGHIPALLFSSHVNDGICDCCDGSDEYDGKMNCSNTCWEAGKVTREKLKKRLATYKEGLVIRKREVEFAKQLMAKEKAELASLKQDEKKLKDVVDKLKETKEAIEKVEEEERLKREKEEQRVRDEEKQAKEQEASESLDSSSEDSQHLPKEVPESSEQDGNEDNENHEEMEQGVDMENAHGETLQDRSEDEGHRKPDDTEELTGAELGRLVASRWTGEDPGQKAEGPIKDHTVHEHDEHYEKMDNEESEHHEEYEDFPSEDEEAEKTDEDEDDESENKDDEEDILESADTPEAARVRKDYNDASHKLSKIQSRISKLENKLKQEYGNEGEFYTFYDHCFELKENKYIYKICPYKEASQEEGHSTTNLGRWGQFKDSYKIMEFSNGDRCWNGPDRSLKIRMKCGLKNELIDVDEPSRCEYVASLLTPALCLEERLKELQRRLDSLNQGIQTHDEL